MKYKLRPPPVVLILFSMPYLNLFTSHIPQGSRNSPVKGCRVASSVKWRLSQPSHWEGGHRFSGSLPCLLQRTVLSPWRPGRSLGGSWTGLDPGSPAWMSPWAQGAPSQETVSDHPLLRSVLMAVRLRLRRLQITGPVARLHIPRLHHCIISEGCHSKSSQTRWPKAADRYSLTVPEAGSPKSGCRRDLGHLPKL